MAEFWVVKTPKAKVMVTAETWREAYEKARVLAEKWATTLTFVTEWRAA